MSCSCSALQHATCTLRRRHPQLLLVLQVGLAAKAAMIWAHQAASIQDEEAVAELTAALQVCSQLCPLIGVSLMLLLLQGRKCAFSRR